MELTWRMNTSTYPVRLGWIHHRLVVLPSHSDLEGPVRGFMHGLCPLEIVDDLITRSPAFSPDTLHWDLQLPPLVLALGVTMGCGHPLKKNCEPITCDMFWSHQRAAPLLGNPEGLVLRQAGAWLQLGCLCPHRPLTGSSSLLPSSQRKCSPGLMNIGEANLRL